MNDKLGSVEYPRVSGSKRKLSSMAHDTQTIGAVTLHPMDGAQGNRSLLVGQLDGVSTPAFDHST
jgi:hypothetical protein